MPPHNARADSLLGGDPLMSYRVRWFGIALLALSGFRTVAAQDAPPLNPPAPADSPVALLQDDNRPVRPLSEGPLHEAFLSPAKDGEPEHADKAPPKEIVERPGVDPPSADAKWILGYW